MTLQMPVKHVQRFRDRYGKMRYYHRPTGTAIKAEWGTPEFLDIVKQLNGIHEKKAKPQGGTLAEIFEEYRQSPAFTKDIAQATRRGYEKYFALIPHMHAFPVKLIDSSMIATMRDKISTKRGSRTANYVMSVMSVVMRFAVEKGYAKANPVKDIKRAKRERDLKKANRPWTEDECRAVLDTSPWHIRVPVALAMYTGLRKRDVLTLTKSEMRSGAIETSKTGVDVTIMLHHELQEVLDLIPENPSEMIAVTTRGTAWTSSGFDSVWDKFKTRLEAEGRIAPGLTMHGLRHTVGNRLAEAGCDLDTIRRVLGQKTLTMAQLYSEHAKKSEASRGAQALLDPRGSRRLPGPEKV